MESEATGLASAETWSFGGLLMELRGLMLLMRKLLGLTLLMRKLFASVHTLSGSLFIPDLAFYLAVLVTGFHRTTGVFSFAPRWTSERCAVAPC